MPAPLSYVPGPAAMPPRRRLPGWTRALIIGVVASTVLSTVAGLAILGWFVYRWMVPDEASATPPEPGFSGFDVCGLISPADAERAGARNSLGPTAVQVIGRVVTTSEAGKPIDTCEYGSDPAAGATLTVSVSPSPIGDHLSNPGGELVAGIGDQAWLAEEYVRAGRTTIVVRRGAAELRVTSSGSDRSWLGGPEDEGTGQLQRQVVPLARKAVAGLPEQVALPAKVATGACASIDEQVIARSLGAPVAYSRGLDSERATACSYAADNGKATTFRLDKEPDEDTSDYASGDRVDVPGHRAYRFDTTVVVYDLLPGLRGKDKRVVHIELPERDRYSEADGAMVKAAADALLGT